MVFLVHMVLIAVRPLHRKQCLALQRFSDFVDRFAGGPGPSPTWCIQGMIGRYQLSSTTLTHSQCFLLVLVRHQPSVTAQCFHQVHRCFLRHC